MNWLTTFLVRIAVRFLRSRGLEVVYPSSLSHARGRLRALHRLTVTSGALTNGPRYRHARTKIRAMADDGLHRLEQARVRV